MKKAPRQYLLFTAAVARYDHPQPRPNQHLEASATEAGVSEIKDEMIPGAPAAVNTGA